MRPPAQATESPGTGRAPRVAMLMRQFHPIRGGYENQSLRLALEMRRRGIAVEVLTVRHRGLSPHEVHEGIAIHRVPAPRIGHVAAVAYLANAAVWMARHRRRFDLIHANRSTSGLIAGLIGVCLRKPVLYKLTRGDEIDKKGLRGTALGALKLAILKRTVDRFVAITAEIERDLRALGVPERKIVRIPNGIELLPPPREDGGVRAELGIEPSAKLVTFVGRLVPEKGVDWLLDAWARVVRERPDVRLLVAGDGPERSRLEARARETGIAPWTRFLGQRDDVPRLLGAADAFALPSRLEGVSNALLEAMAAGLPVVVGDDSLGGNREIVRDGVEGLLVPRDDVEGLATALSRLLADGDLRRRLGAAARSAAEERFSIAGVAGRYEALYEEILSERRRPLARRWRLA